MNTTKRRSPSTSLVGNDVARELSSQILAEDRRIVKQSNGKVSEEQYLNALDRIAVGETMRAVTSSIGISRSALLIRAYEDENFASMLDKALEMGAWARTENAEEMILSADPTPAELKRAALYADWVKWMASRLNRQRFGDRVQHDVRSLTIVLDPSADSY